MHARELVELAALVAAHAPALVESSKGITDQQQESYRVACKGRLDRWLRFLNRLSEQGDSPASAQEVRAVIEEVLTGEVLARVWTAAMAAYDQGHRIGLMQPIAANVLTGHLEARRRVLALLVSGPGIGTEEAVRLNRLRCRTERWSDMLVGCLASHYDVASLASDPDRAADFAEDLAQQRREQGNRQVWPLVLSSLHAAFGQGLSPTSPNADLNAQIAQSVLACFPADAFTGTGLFRSLWSFHLAGAGRDMYGEVDSLFRPHMLSGVARSAIHIPSLRSDRRHHLGD